MPSAQYDCPLCDQPRLFQKDGTSDLTHILLCIITGGLWLPIWFVLIICGGAPWRCTICGSTPRGSFIGKAITVGGIAVLIAFALIVFESVKSRGQSHRAQAAEPTNAAVSEMPARVAPRVAPTPTLSSMPTAAPSRLADAPIPDPAFESSVAASRKRAISVYPALAIEGSHFNQAFVARYYELARRQDPFLNDAAWPEKLARQCAAQLPAGYR